ncbi:signal peptidase 22kDa subunit [Sporodiniella umbellata]|nr:signal peptidase 22kDa subunit [Sporodiniella umbellata]
MYNLQQRANAFSSFSVTVISTVLSLVAFISYIQGYNPIQSSVYLDANKVKVVARRFGPENFDYRTKTEFVRFNFDLEADFQSFFHWNTKQIFVALVAEYSTQDHKRNQVVVWDKIIKDKSSAHLKVKNLSNKYAMVDISRRWNFEHANLSLAYDVTPHVGWLQSGKTFTQTTLTLPSLQ